jgi:glucokinase
MPVVPAASANQPATLGVDVGGTKLAAALITGTRAELHVEHPTALDSGDAVVSGIEAAAREVIAQAGDRRPIAVGVGVPSQIDHASGRVLASVNIPLEGVELGRELSGRLGLPVHVDNDANCAALAEAQFVDGGPARYLVMYTLGTGVGGGIVIDGRIYRGATGLGAELGHAVIQYDGPPCPGTCPNRGCLEALCSGTALEREAAAVAKDFPDSALGRAAAQNDGKLRGLHVVEAAEAGDVHALGLFDALGMLFGVGLAGAINTFEPEQIVVGGGLSRASQFFFERAVHEARARALPVLAARVKISLAKAGPAAGVIGAGLLALHESESGNGEPGNGDTAGATASEGAR